MLKQMDKRVFAVFHSKSYLDPCMPIDAFWSTVYIVYISSCNLEALPVIWGNRGKMAFTCMSGE